MASKLPGAAYRFAEKSWRGAYQKWQWESAPWRVYGMKMNDMYNDKAEEIAEAVRRLPEDIQQARNFRIIRAIQNNMNKTILPKEQWTKWEEEDFYLEPYLEEVLKEYKEREEWRKK